MSKIKVTVVPKDIGRGYVHEHQRSNTLEVYTLWYAPHKDPLKPRKDVVRIAYGGTLSPNDVNFVIHDANFYIEYNPRTNVYRIIDNPEDGSYYEVAEIRIEVVE